MHLIRFVRICVPLVTFGLVACVLGCSPEPTGQGTAPPDKEASKKIAEEMKSSMQEKMKAMRAQTKGKAAR